MFETDGDDKTSALTLSSVQTPETTTTTSSEPDASWATMIEVNAITNDPTAQEPSSKHSQHQATAIDDTTHKVSCLY